MYFWLRNGVQMLIVVQMLTTVNGLPNISNEFGEPEKNDSPIREAFGGLVDTIVVWMSAARLVSNDPFYSMFIVFSIIRTNKRTLDNERISPWSLLRDSSINHQTQWLLMVVAIAIGPLSSDQCPTVATCLKMELVSNSLFNRGARYEVDVPCWHLGHSIGFMIVRMLLFDIFCEWPLTKSWH